MDWHIGCSGFHYKEWKGHFYPDKLPQKDWFNYYSQQFDTLELNVTFYRFPQLAGLKKWFDQSPSHFLFSVKAPRLITHYKQFSGVEKLLQDFYTTIRMGLGKKLGAVLFQLPPQMIYTDERMERMINCMDNSFQNVIEFRHSSWWKKKVYDALGKKNISFCGSSYPGLPDKPIINTAVVYYRFHGVPVLYKSAYTDEQLKKIADSIQKSKKATTVFIYFNNTASAAALANAGFLKKIIGEETPA
jgi:uncharacterized protein YecE (DUF72 family)